MGEESEIPWANPEKNAGSTVQVSGHPMGQYTTTNATLALVLAAVSWFLGCWICTAIPAVILANGALAITNSQPGHPDQGLAKAAQILGWVNIVVVGVIIIGYILLIAVVIGAGASG
jgi:hypothetical protein